MRSFFYPIYRSYDSGCGFSTSSVSTKCLLFTVNDFIFQGIWRKCDTLGNSCRRSCIWSQDVEKTPASMIRNAKKMLPMQYVKLQYLLVPKIRPRLYPSSASKNVVPLWDGECQLQEVLMRTYYPIIDKTLCNSNV